MSEDNKSIIDTLQHNIASRFEELYEKKNIAKDINNQVISPEFICVMDGDLFAPKAKGNKIIVQANYISFLWGFIYGAWVQFEELMMKDELIQQGRKDITQNKDVIKRSQNILSYTLNTMSYMWPEGYPNPNLTSTIDDENFYASKVNGIFVDALCILLFHEVCHIKSKHYENWRNFDDETKIQCEKDCDAFALKVVIADYLDTSEEEYNTKMIAVLMAFATMFFLLKNPLLITQKNHPDLALRLANMISFLDIQDDGHLYYIYKFADILLRHFRGIHRKIYDFMEVCFDDKPVETAEDLFDRDLEKIRIPVTYLSCNEFKHEYIKQEIYGYLSEEDVPEADKGSLNFITLNEIMQTCREEHIESFLYAKKEFYEVTRNDSAHFKDSFYHYTVKAVSADFVSKASKEKVI